MRQQIANLIVAGSDRKTVLSIVGCSAEYLDSLLKDESFRQEVTEAKAAATDDKIDALYADVEKKTLSKIKDNLDLYDATALTKILTSVAQNRIARRLPAQSNGHYNNPTVGIQVTVPIFLNQSGNSQVVMDSKNQVIAIQGRSMAPLPIDSVHKLFNDLDKQEAIKKEINDAEDPVEADYDREVAEGRISPVSRIGGSAQADVPVSESHSEREAAAA
jgi:hypothetical protein